jgi:hypothetical protein
MNLLQLARMVKIDRIEAAIKKCRRDVQSQLPIKRDFEFTPQMWGRRVKAITDAEIKCLTDVERIIRKD